MSGRVKLEFSSDPALLCVVRGAVQQFAAVAGLPARGCREVTRAVDEALANIIRHAYAGRAGQPIGLTCSHAEDRLEFVLTDRGRRVQPSKIHGRSLDELRPGGLGTHLIRAAMDDVQYRRKRRWNILRLVKYLSGPRLRKRF